MGGPFSGIVQGIALGFDLMTDDDKLVVILDQRCKCH